MLDVVIFPVEHLVWLVVVVGNMLSRVHMCNTVEQSQAHDVHGFLHQGQSSLLRH